MAHGTTRNCLTQTFNIFAFFISPVPEEAPAFLQGYPLTATSIHVSWKGLPPSRHKEQLLGYRVKYRPVGSKRYNEVNVTSNFTEAVLEVVPETKYEIEVNGFNEIGQGPSGKVLVVKTLSFGKLEFTSSSSSCQLRLSFMALYY